MPYSPGGYSWLGVTGEPKNVSMTEKEKSRFDSDLDAMRDAAISLESKIQLYNKLCTQYESKAGTKQGERLHKKIEELRKEIHYLSKHISKSLDDTSDITHLD